MFSTLILDGKEFRNNRFYQVRLNSNSQPLLLFEGKRFIYCRFTLCDLSCVTFNYCIFENVVFDCCDMHAVTFNNCYLEEVEAKHTRFYVEINDSVIKSMYTHTGVAPQLNNTYWYKWDNYLLDAKHYFLCKYYPTRYVPRKDLANGNYKFPQPLQYRFDSYIKLWLMVTSETEPLARLRSQTIWNTYEKL